MQQREGRNRRRIATLAILILAAVWLWWAAAGGDEPETAAAAPAPRPDPGKAAVMRVEQPVTAEVRDDLTEPPFTPAPDPDLAHPFEYALDLRLCDAFGLPVPGALTFAAPPLCGFSLWPHVSDARGQVQLRWLGRIARMQLQVVVLVWGVLQPIRLFDLDAGRTQVQTLVVRAREQTEEALARLRQRTPDGVVEDAQKSRRGRLRRTDELDLLCGRTLLLFREFECTACHEPSKLAGYATLARCGVISPGLHPFASFQDQRSGALTDAQRLERQRMLDESEAAPEDRGSMREGERWWFVTGVVREPDGRPAARVPVAWLGDKGALHKRTWTNADGRYRLGPVAPGLLTLVAGGGEGGDARASVAVSGSNMQWDFQLERTSAVRGTARDEHGGVLIDWRVEFERDEGDWADFAQTQKDGGFVMPSVPGMGRLLLWPADADLRLPVQYGRAAAPDGDPLALWLDPLLPTRARLRLRPLLPAGKGPSPPIDARIFQLDTGRGAVLPPLGQDEAFELGGLAAGPYRIEVGAPTLGWVDCGIRHLDGRGLWDIGYVNLPVPGRLQLRTAPGTRSPLQFEHACYRRLEAMDVLEQGREGTEGSLLLPPGEHLLFWREKAGVRSLAFRITSAAVTEVDVPPR